MTESILVDNTENEDLRALKVDQLLHELELTLGDPNNFAPGKERPERIAHELITELEGELDNMTTEERAKFDDLKEKVPEIFPSS